MEDNCSTDPMRPRAEGFLPIQKLWQVLLIVAFISGIFFANLWAYWGFVVDDAWILAKMAQEIAEHSVYRFAATGPSVDAATPLAYPWLFAWVGKSISDKLLALRLVGLGAVVASYGLLLTEVKPLVSALDRQKNQYLAMVYALAPLMALALAAPLMIWAGSGLETGLIACLVTLGLGLVNDNWRRACLGLAVFWRPELLPMALAQSVGEWFFFRVENGEKERPQLNIAVRFGPLLLLGAFLSAMLLRAAIWGDPFPLSLRAKPSNMQGSWPYIWQGLLLSSAIFWLPFRGFKSSTTRLNPTLKPSPKLRAFPWAVGAQLFAIFLAGGDWMPAFRLLVPIIPGLFIWHLMFRRHTAIHETAPLTGAKLGWDSFRIAASLLVSLSFLFSFSEKCRGTYQRRVDLIEEARAVLKAEPGIVALDIGWLAEAYDGPIIDIGGVTEPKVARLPGFHAAKKLPKDFIKKQAGAGILLLVSMPEEEKISGEGMPPGLRTVEKRLWPLLVEAGYIQAAELPIRGTQYRYWLYLPKARINEPKL